ncbi:MAG: DNA mismatch repair protein MutS [Chloroflexota bacterium]|nr:DNA mismatch repair protein MutS [Chloroflexota bacterium]
MASGTTLTPVRRQYLKVKSAHPDAIVLFRMGDFYETFDEDAEVASRALEITLTSRTLGRNIRVPMAGVPAHSLENYLARLIKKGHKVAICEQLTDPAKSRGLVERDVVRVVTPGTVFESALLEQDANNYLAAVVEDGDRTGLAYVDITTGEFAATEIGRSGLAPELARIAPAEILIPAGEELPRWIPEDARPRLTGVAQQEPGDGLPITQVNPAAFDHDLAKGALLDHFEIQTLESFGCEHLMLATRAAGAIVDYLSQTHKAVAPRLAALSVYSSESFMTLDEQTRRNLELFQAGRWENRSLSLFAALDQTRTPMGGRLLRRWVGQPLLDLAALQQRLDAVECFVDGGLQRARTRETLSGLSDLERILGRVQTETAAPRDLVALRAGIAAGDALREALSNDETGRIGWLCRQIVSIPELGNLIDEAINPEPSGGVGDGGVIREGFSTELDELKEASTNARSFIAGLEERERDRTGIRNLRVGYNQVFGYYLEVSKSNLGQVPDDYIRRQTLTNGERYIVPELKEYESLVLNARERLGELERSLYRQVCAQIGGHAEAIGRLASAIAAVDVFASLAEVAAQHRYVRPRIDEGQSISVKNGRHPVVERHLGTGSFVPNDVELSNNDARVVVLTGPNMAGKSTFIRQAAIIVLMAQVGSFVPADEATIGLVDRIFTRVGLQDDLATGQSTFMVEMVETAAILNQATPRSLVVLDEIGRGTSTYDGLSIARSVIEYLHNDPRLGCKSLFATHYHELTELAKTLPGVRNFSVAVTEEEGRVVFLHRIVPGGADRSYGVHVAQLAGLPRSVVSRAWEVLEDLEQAGNGRHTASPRRKSEAAIQMPLFQPEQPLKDAVLGLDVANLTPLEAINKLYELQERAREGEQ